MKRALQEDEEEDNDGSVKSLQLLGALQVLPQLSEAECILLHEELTKKVRLIEKKKNVREDAKVYAFIQESLKNTTLEDIVTRVRTNPCCITIEGSSDSPYGWRV